MKEDDTAHGLWHHECPQGCIPVAALFACHGAFRVGQKPRAPGRVHQMEEVQNVDNQPPLMLNQLFMKILFQRLKETP